MSLLTQATCGFCTNSLASSCNRQLVLANACLHTKSQKCIYICSQNR